MEDTKEVFIVTNRYDALGMPHPDPETMCSGECEGTGWVPIYNPEGDPQKDDPTRARPVYEPEPESEKEALFQELWQQAEADHPTDDGWHFVKCPDCNGTGKRETSA